MLAELAAVLGCEPAHLPPVFTALALPLKVGTYQDLRQRYPATRVKPLQRWLYRWTRSRQYLEAIAKGGARLSR